MKARIRKLFKGQGYVGARYYSRTEAAALAELTKEGKAKMKVISGIVSYKIS